ncbi:enterobactin synthase subunit EntD [Klebsiella pneumoniae subsp. pneumoniae]|nr:enterobactin synthase subunit EntD [Klebsiella pneumoniae subsp. pneumoniae]
MRHHRTVLPLAGYTIQQIDFDPATFQPEDLFWLPYHASLTGWGGKRQAEHLAGRIAPRHTPCARWGRKRLPAIGDQRQPLWPTPWFGSISHCGQRALAVIADRPVGVDIERRFTPQLAAELESSIISPAEKRRCCAAACPFPLALTLAFSAKESGFKATPAANQRALGFADFQIVEITASTLSAYVCGAALSLHWIASEDQIITLCALQQ